MTNIEFEAKFLNIRRKEVVKLLINHRATLLHPSSLMKRQTFDFKNLQKGEKKWVRVRQEFGKITLTLKQVTDKNSIDGVKEIELAVNDFSTACELITNLGLLPGPYQENFRETWELNDCLVTIDEWPGLEPFIEIEGESEEVVMAAIGLLEINPEEAVYGSVDFLYEDIHNISPKKFNKIKRLDFENYKSVLSGTAIKRKSRYNIKCSKK